MLPDLGTPEREALEQEALALGLEKLHETDGIIVEALYQVYEHFRERFLDEAGPNSNSEFKEALVDARRLEAHVSQCWATAIVMQYDRR